MIYVLIPRKQKVLILARSDYTGAELSSAVLFGDSIRLRDVPTRPVYGAVEVCGLSTDPLVDSNPQQLYSDYWIAAAADADSFPIQISLALR